MKQLDAFQKYLDRHKIKSKQVELELSDSDAKKKSSNK